VLRLLSASVFFSILALTIGCTSLPQGGSNESDPNAPPALAADINQFKNVDSTGCKLPSGNTLRIDVYNRMFNQPRKIELTISASVDGKEFMRVLLVGDNSGGKGDVYLKEGGKWSVNRNVSDREVGGIVVPYFDRTFTKEELVYCRKNNVR
jgi:hypothetical protein